MYKRYKRLVYTSPDLLARFCKVNLSNAKTSASFVFQEFVFPGLIYCDQEPLWLCYFLGVHIRLLTRCKIKFTLSLDCFANYFSRKSLSLSLKMSHECGLKLTDLWKTSLLFYLNYKFDLIGASLLALVEFIYYEICCRISSAGSSISFSDLKYRNNLYRIIKSTKQEHKKVLLSSFHWNVCTLRFHSQS